MRNFLLLTFVCLLATACDKCKDDDLRLDFSSGNFFSVNELVEHGVQDNCRDTPYWEDATVRVRGRIDVSSLSGAGFAMPDDDFNRSLRVNITGDSAAIQQKIAVNVAKIFRIAGRGASVEQPMNYRCKKALVVELSRAEDLEVE